MSQRLCDSAALVATGTVYLCFLICASSFVMQTLSIRILTMRSCPHLLAVLFSHRCLHGGACVLSCVCSRVCALVCVLSWCVLSCARVTIFVTRRFLRKVEELRAKFWCHTSRHLGGRDVETKWEYGHGRAGCAGQRW
jgi:hypothetical protein